MSEDPRPTPLHDLSGFPDGWEYELRRVSEAVFGRRYDGFGNREEGVIDRLARLETLLRWGVAFAGVVGAGIGSACTLLVQSFLSAKLGH